MGRDGLVISLREAGFFDSGSATPKAGGPADAAPDCGIAGRPPYDLRIEGHTDNVPIHNAEFDSNWELSSARATHIARLFLEMKAIPPDRLSAAGYAEFHPVASNDTAEGRAENRRVDLVVMPRTKINFAAGDASTTRRARGGRVTDRNNERRGGESGLGLRSYLSLLHAEDFYDDALAALAVELGVEDALPGAQVEFAVGDGQCGFVVQEQRLQVRVAVVLAGRWCL